MTHHIPLVSLDNPNQFPRPIEIQPARVMHLRGSGSTLDHSRAYHNYLERHEDSMPIGVIIKTFNSNQDLTASVEAVLRRGVNNRLLQMVRSGDNPSTSNELSTLIETRSLAAEKSSDTNTENLMIGNLEPSVQENQEARTTELKNIRIPETTTVIVNPTRPKRQVPAAKKAG